MRCRRLESPFLRAAFQWTSATKMDAGGRVSGGGCSQPASTPARRRTRGMRNCKCHDGRQGKGTCNSHIFTSALQVPPSPPSSLVASLSTSTSLSPPPPPLPPLSLSPLHRGPLTESKTLGRQPRHLACCCLRRAHTQPSPSTAHHVFRPRHCPAASPTPSALVERVPLRACVRACESRRVSSRLACRLSVRSCLCFLHPTPPNPPSPRDGRVSSSSCLAWALAQRLASPRCPNGACVPHRTTAAAIGSGRVVSCRRRSRSTQLPQSSTARPAERATSDGTAYAPSSCLARDARTAHAHTAQRHAPYRRFVSSCIAVDIDVRTMP